MADEKKIVKQTFTDGVDSDTADELLPNNRVRSMLNIRPFKAGTRNVATYAAGNTLIPNINLPTVGVNTCLGWTKNEEEGKLYWFNHNTSGYHGIYCFDSIKRNITPILQNLIDTNNVDILGFSTDYLINMVDIVQDNLIYWVDGLNKARKFNINKAIDKYTTGYGTVIAEDFITAYKQTGVYAPPIAYFTDLTRTSNYLYALQFKFAFRYYYDDNEVSTFSDWSAVAYPPNESYLGQNAITFTNNGINVTVQTGNKLVTKIEIVVKIDTDDFVGCAMLNKAQLGIPDYGTYTYQFFNDGAYWAIDQTKVAKTQSYLPRVPYTQAFVKVAMTYGNFYEGFEVVKILGSIAITYNDFYLPAGTESELNNPALTSNIVSADSSGGLFNKYVSMVDSFLVGVDVKKGNVFTLYQLGGKQSTQFSYTANLSDSAVTVASYIKQYLRGLDGLDISITDEVTDGSGNVTWKLHIKSHEGDAGIYFLTDVIPVNFSKLVDNGLSINSIKMGSSTKYAVVYCDDDGRESQAYTTDSLLAKTLFETETTLGNTVPLGLKQPVHTISILNQPPIWAKYWKLVRTNGTPQFIQLLIQQVNSVTVTASTVYLDLVVGSLLTYQKIHPDTILTYEFTRGDRLRLISNENTIPPTYYTPFFETEVLSYSTNTEEFVNANIHTTDASANVTPSKPVDSNYVGKDIIINDVTRTIVGISGSDYVLDQPLVGTFTFPNYRFVDTRGIIRIKKPPVGIDVVNQSLIELYKPIANTDSIGYQNFYDFQQKFEVANWGTPTRAHRGNLQDQDGTNSTTLVSTPAIIQVTQGDSFVRNRAMPSNNSIEDTQVIVDRIADPNFSDFYQSNLLSLGKVYPQDQGYGVVKFDSRERFSNNYIQGTRVNGLNDFDSLDRKDYNDPYGAITLTKFKKGYLFLFKELKSCWTPVNQKIIVDNAGSQTLATSDELLNELQYAEWDGGIGNNGESWVENGNAQYIASANSSVFLRIAQDGSDPISYLYFYDSRASDILSNVKKHNLRVFGGFDRDNDEAIWSVPDYYDYLFNNKFDAGDWQTFLNSYPTGTTFTITQQPANATATVVGTTIQITGTSTLGNDFFKLQGNLPGGGTTPVVNFCFNVVAETGNTIWVGDNTTLYCEQVGGNNTGQQNFAVLKEQFQASGNLTGNIMPNVLNIDPLAIVKSTSVITFNTTNITPTGGSLDDVWYNSPSDALYKNIGGGVWQILTNKATNPYYLPSVLNTIACAIGYSILSLNFSTVSTDVCGVSPTVVYTVSGVTDITTGTALFTYADLTTPVTGYNFVVSMTGDIYNIDIATGIVGTTTGGTCTLASIDVDNSSSSDVTIGVYTVGGILITSFPVTAAHIVSNSIPPDTYNIRVSGNPTVNAIVTVNSDTQNMSASGLPTTLYFSYESTNITITITDNP